jgi:hypothetical protein
MEKNESLPEKMIDEWDIDGEWFPRKTLPFGEAK